MAEVETARTRKTRARRPSEGAEADSPDPVEIAMKAVAAGAVPGSAAQTVLEKHACLIDIQCQREREEWHVLRIQRLTRWVILAAVLGLLAGLCAMVWNASRSSSLVIEPFGVPPSLAQRGLTGKVVSARLLDRLAELQRQTESMRGEKSYADNWQDDIQLDIPQTGVSISEAWRTLKGWLGEETRIGGEVVQSAAGLSITTRAGSLSGGTVQGPEGETDRLLGEAARAIYKVTQPYRYAISLPRERHSEMEQMLRALTGDPSPVERVWAYSGLSRSARETGDYPRARAMARRALAIDPELLPALGNLGLAERGMAHDQAMLDAFLALERVWAKGEPEGYDVRVAGLNRAFSRAAIAERLGDAPGIFRSSRHLTEAGASTFLAASVSLSAVAAAVAHDFPRASAAASHYGEASDVEDFADSAALAAFVALARARDHGDAAGAKAAAEQYLRSSLPSLTRLFGPERGAEAASRSLWPQVAIAYAKAGMAREAAAIASRLPTDCYDCVRARGLANLADGRREAAARWFAEAVRQGPSIPMAYAEWGELLLRSGDAAAAAARFAEANRKGPRWADPLKLWGDALGRQGKDLEAVEKYRQAAERAPRWAALHVEWGKALWRAGRRDEARARFRAAAAMDLNGPDRALLARIAAQARRIPSPGAGRAS